MGQKIHPYGLRLGIVTDWKSRWYSEKDYARQVNEDNQIRTYLRGELKRGAVSRIDVERIGDKKVQVDVHTARPGVVIGRGGSEAERLRTGLEKLSKRIVKFNVIEVQNPELDATLLARSVADQLEGRVAFRRAMKRTVSTALKAGAEGVRVQASGRLGGADMGRREWYLEGRVPLHTLRADIDFGQATATTTVGAIGVKVWVYKGDVLATSGLRDEKIAAEARLATGGPAERRRRRSAKSRAEAAAGGRESRLIEAGGGKRLIEAGGGKRKEGGKRLIEAGGGKRPSAAEAEALFEEEREIGDAAEAADAASSDDPRPTSHEEAAGAAKAADAASSDDPRPTSHEDTAVEVVETVMGESATSAQGAEVEVTETPSDDDSPEADKTVNGERSTDDAESAEAVNGERTTDNSSSASDHEEEE
jgi:small subunit ribosomal protein S3